MRKFLRADLVLDEPFFYGAVERFIKTTQEGYRLNLSH